ncbi:very-long-chain (3R)-3-hydroxyacyl-CoA dehydratase 3-like [Asterias amurensis]|uniref:very-long-chain (3R)-3-hydroxyacyl-CoA dehydratase 3-like n=1 Tax=Asterias amurensis TaxID=7602 RepID=UPI003AB66EFF
MSGDGVLHPLVYWAQTDKNVSLKVDISDVTNHKIVVTDENLQFEAQGVGPAGLHSYKFSLDFYGAVDEEKSTYRVLDRNVEISLAKAAKSDFWPRVTYKKEKAAWLRLDFDKLELEDSEGEQEQVQKVDHRAKIKELEKQIIDAQDKAYTDMKTAYLFVYNLLQFIMYTYVSILLFTWFILYGKDDMNAAFERAFYPLGIAQILAVLEIVHPLTGLVKTGVAAPIMQVLGRDLVLFLIIVPIEELHSEPIVCYLFLIWSAIEVVRYPYYIFATLDYDSEVVTWLRYTMWMPLYPLGILSEGIVAHLAIPYAQERGIFSMSLPNSFNFAFRFDYYLYVHLALLVLLGPFMLTHMWKLRQKRFGPKRKVKAH